MLVQNSKPTPDRIAITFYRPKSRRHARMRAPVWFVALCLALAGGLVAGQTPTSSQQQRRPRLAGSVPPLPDMASANFSGGEEVSEGDVVRVNTQLITVPVVVRDQQGRPVTGLTASAFELYEDNCPQRLATFNPSDSPFELPLRLD